MQGKRDGKKEVKDKLIEEGTCRRIYLEIQRMKECEIS